MCFSTKYWLAGDLNSLVKNIGEERARGIARGDLEITGVRKVLKSLFDKHGRRIPKDLQAKVCDANRNFKLDQPKLNREVDFTNRIMRLHGCLSIDTEVTAEQFRAETERLLGIIKKSPQIANIANGVYLPVVLPKLITEDLGAELDLYLAGVNNSYSKTFGSRKFHNYCNGVLTNEVSITEGSRHDQLVERMKQGPVIGLHFPNPLQGFSIHADREQTSTLPEGFNLSGMDTLIAMIMYPDILARDWNTPGLDLAAFSWQSVGDSFSFRANDDRLDFGIAGYLALANVYYSGGLLFLG